MGIIAAAEAASSSKSGSSSFTFLILIVLVFVGFYFLMIRPQRRRQQQVREQQSTVNPGARVRTTAGMYATVVAVDGDDVILEVAPDVEVRYLKRAIMEVISSGEPEEPEAEAEFDESEAPADGTHEDIQDVDSDEHGVADVHAEDAHDELTPSDKDKVV
jgi:preprotein translocase subunit YajC